MADIAMSSIPSRRPGVLDAAVGEDIVLLGESSRYHGLDTTGARVWQLVDGNNSISDICTTLVAEYEVDSDTCTQDVLAFLHDLADHDLVVIR